MTVKSKAIELALTGVARWVASPAAWEQVKALVAEVGRLDVDGEEKRRLVTAQAKQIGWRWADWALNLLIEIAVAVIHQKLGKALS